MLAPVLPPGVNFSFVGVDARFFFMGMPMDWQTFLLPAAHRALAAVQIAGNLLPRIEAVAVSGAGRLLPYIGHMISHKIGPAAGYLSRADFTAAILARQRRYCVLQEAVKCGHWESGRICVLRIGGQGPSVAKNRL